MEELRAAIARVREGDTTLKLGPHCKFCNAKAICPEKRDEATGLARLAFKDVAKPFQLPKPQEMDPEFIGHILKNAIILRDWADSVVAYAHSIAETGVEIPGYKLVGKRGNRRWINEIAVAQTFEFDFGNEIYMPPKLRSPAQMEKLVGKRQQALIDQLCEKPDTGKTLVPVEDDREARLPDSVEAFLDL
jgi:hypothetical protein